MPPVQNENGTPPPQAPPKQYGPLIGIIIIVVLLAVGGLYLWGMQLMKKDEVAPPTEESDKITEDLRTYDDSDDLNVIEADLEATSIESLDSGASEVEGDLQVQ